MLIPYTLEPPHAVGDHGDVVSCAQDNLHDEDDNEEAVGPNVWARVDLAKTIGEVMHLYRALYPEHLATVQTQTPTVLQEKLRQPNFIGLVRQFLSDQLQTDPDHPPAQLPELPEQISVHPSAVATFYAPSDICGVNGMRRERIRAVPSWRRGLGRYDCIFVNADPLAEGMRGLEVARVRSFFSFKSCGVTYPCALVHWYSRVGDEPDPATGMWIVERDINPDGLPSAAVIHLDSIVRAAHLLGVCGNDFVPKKLSHDASLDAFHAYYVNKYIDHHAFEIAF